MATISTPIRPPGERFQDMTLARAKQIETDPELLELISTLEKRVSTVKVEQNIFKAWCDRADNLYYTDDFTAGGADLWAAHRSATEDGRSHVSINTPPVYVDVPAALQAVRPIENMLATKNDPDARTAAQQLERTYVAWKAEESFDLKFHKACVVKGLYGRTAGRVYWKEGEDGEIGRPCIEIVEQPRNLYLGYKSDSYEELEWAAYVMRYDPNALSEEYGVEVIPFMTRDGVQVPLVRVPSPESGPVRPYLDFADARIEVWDYWYRQPVWNKRGKFLRMDTYNVVVAGNFLLRPPTKYAEYRGRLPYVPLFNTFIPGVPNGRPDLYDMEQIIREKFEKVTAGSQMIANGTSGDFWQLVGPDAPMRVPDNLKPKRNAVIGPGPGNRIEAITPFIAQFQLEQYLGRLDREAATISGLNDLLLGLAPLQSLSSSKAVNALIANYESRISIRRMLLYAWRKNVWALAVRIWSAKSDIIADIVKAGGGTLDIIDPSLSPRDEMETATRAANLVNAKLWSQARGMDAVGVDDPEQEQDLIREESTDATLWPERVQIMASLLSALQGLGLPTPAGVQDQANAQMAGGQADLRKALGLATPDNTVGSQLPGDQGLMPPIPGAGVEAGGAAAPFASAQAGTGGQQSAVLQGMIQNGTVKSRIMTQRQLGRK